MCNLTMDIHVCYEETIRSIPKKSLLKDDVTMIFMEPYPHVS